MTSFWFRIPQSESCSRSWQHFGKTAWKRHLRASPPSVTIWSGNVGKVFGEQDACQKGVGCRGFVASSLFRALSPWFWEREREEKRLPQCDTESSWFARYICKSYTDKYQCTICQPMHGSLLFPNWIISPASLRTESGSRHGSSVFPTITVITHKAQKSLAKTGLLALKPAY